MTRSLAFGRTVDTLEVVLVQDNRGAQAILRSLISSLRVKRLRVFERAEDAIKQMMNDPPHVVIADWEMKPTSGYRLIRLMRSKQMKPLCFMPVIVMTSNATLSMVDRAFTAGASSVLVKPIAPIAMLRRLEWSTLDDREFVLDGDHYVLDGIEEILETRVRRSQINSMRRQALQEALVAHAANGAGEAEVPEEPAHRNAETWNSWAMR